MSRRKGIMPGQHTSGFTLIELVVVILIMGILAMGVSRYISTGTQIYVDVTERDKLLSDSRFVVEKLNREIRNALPNSFRVAGDASLGHCLEFIPVVWSTYYFDVPVSPEPASATIDAIKWQDSDAYRYEPSHFVVVYPVSTNDIYGNTNHKVKIGNAPTENGNRVTINLSQSHRFTTDSPSSRLYVTGRPISYCVANGRITRYEGYGDPSPTQPVVIANGQLVAENNANTLSDSAGNGPQDPFQVIPATLTRNGAVRLLLQFERGDERVSFYNEVHQPNVP